jgi:hypothetical protein
MDSESTNDGRNDPRQTPALVELQVFGDSTSAELAKGILETGGIKCCLHTDDCGGMYPSMDLVRGVTLLVRSSDYDKAKALLAAEPAKTQPPPETPGDAVPPQSRSSLLQVAAGLIIGVLLCVLYQWTSKFGTKTYRYDTNGDRKTDETATYRNGHLIEHAYDRNFDGKLDFWDHYDSSFKLMLSKADDNFDGVPDGTWRYDDGLLVSSTADTDFNGTADVTHTFKDDLVVQSDWRPNGTNIITLRQFFRHGVLTEETRDTNMDGSFDVTIRYDAFQNVIRTNAFMLLSPASR